jgi:hypothetical protein
MQDIKVYTMAILQFNSRMSITLHLGISALILIPVAVVYGISPELAMSKLFDFKVQTVDLKNIVRAIMGLYLAIAACCAIGIFKPGFWVTATITNIFFMGGLSAGRLLSLILDGVPTINFSIGLLLELLLTFWGVWNIRNCKIFT